MTTAESISGLCRFVGSRRVPVDPWHKYRQAVQWAKDQGLMKATKSAPVKSDWQRYTPTADVMRKYNEIKALVDSGVTVKQAAKELGYGQTVYYRVRKWKQHNEA